MSSDSRSEPHQWTILKLLQWTASYLQRHGIEQARPDAEILLAHVLDCRRIDLYLRYDQPLIADELARFKALLKRRTARCPVAYILGEKEFWSLNMSVSPEVLIPRPETECLVEDVLNSHGADTRLKVLELGTGSGAISIALAAERPAWQFQATDVSPEAIALAEKNALRHKVDQRIDFLEGDWFDPLTEGSPYFDIIISNPPYIASAELTRLAPEIREFEPVKALDGGLTGLDCIEHIIKASPGYLAPGGQLVLEIGSDQGSPVQQLGAGVDAFDHISISRDYGGLDRIAKLRLKKGGSPPVSGD